MAKLARSAVAATDGAAVASTAQHLSVKGAAVAGLNVTLTGSPTTYAVRAVIEGSFDGTVWHELVRFKDYPVADAAQGFYEAADADRRHCTDGHDRGLRTWWIGPSPGGSRKARTMARCWWCLR